VSTKENTAIARRVDALAAELAVLEPLRISTVLEVRERGPEPRCATVAEVRTAAADRPRPRVVERIEDLDCLIDAETGVHVLRHEVDPDEFDRVAAGVRHVRVKIPCHPGQVALIRSCIPLTETRGGARAGKTRIAVWWLFRQWLLRGHGLDGDHDEPAKFWWIREDTEKLYEYAILPLLQLWPAEVFSGKPPTETARKPKLRLIDRSSVAFRHANFSGGKAGTNLRSASVEAVVVDEKSAIHNRENWREILNRVSQTGGPIFTATTPAAGHWSEQDAEGDDAGGTVYVASVDRFQNPWITIPSLFSDMLKERLVTAAQMAEEILPAADQVEAAKALIVQPDARRSWLGQLVPAGLPLWREWSDDLVVHDGERVRDSLEVDGFGKLPCITAAVLGRYFNRDDRPSPGKHWIGQDFNVNPCVGVVLQVFGEVHRRESWHVLVVDEVASEGSTAAYAEALAKRYPRSVGFCDPTGAMPGRHASHGAKSSTDAAELDRAGHYVQPANGRENGKAKHLPQKDSINVVHRLHRERRLLVHARCTGVLEAMRTMQARSDGTIDKVSGRNSRSDQISAYGDGVRYGVWRPLRHVLVESSTQYGSPP